MRSKPFVFYPLNFILTQEYRKFCMIVSDSIASMESIMDLPSNVAFEIVDILQNKMLGKIFGKATFCINAKCITLVASKKIFGKARCFIKELNTAGHCSNVKPVKVM